MINKNKVAIVTGGGQGIGKAFVKKLLEKDFKVMLAEIDLKAGEETVAEYKKYGKLQLFRTDVSLEHEVREMVDFTIDLWERIDLLINNAGVFLEKPIEEILFREWEQVLSVNLSAPFLCSKYCAPFLRHSKGSIINIASTRALMSEPNTEAYAASKGGIVALTHALAISLGPDVKVNSISPGWIETDDWKKKETRRDPQIEKKDHSQHPSGRVGRPEDVAAFLDILAEPGNEFITGANFIIDGGMTRKMIYV